MEANTGTAYVFVRSGTTWSQQAKLLADDGAGSDHFGTSVSVSADTAVVGAYCSHWVGVGCGPGAAYVFVRSGTTWTQEAKLRASDGGANDHFAYSVSIAGDMAVVGAFRKNTDTGAAYVFARRGTAWPEQLTLVAGDGATGDDFGYSVSISGDTVAVGASNKSSGAGAAYAFVITKANGEPCATAVECHSGYCVDATCCEEVCTATCKSCANASGTCANVAAGQTDPNASPTCLAPHACDGQGACKKVTGQTCAAAAECVSGYCVDATCCADACTTTCRSCANAAGTCTTNVPVGAEDPSSSPPCSWASGMACDGAGSCKKADGEACLTGGECASTACTDHVCCNEECDSPCHSCHLDQHVGTCMPVPDNEDPRQECQASSGGNPTCAGKCVGRQCAYPDVGTSCGLCAACDGTGRCTTTPADDPACGTIVCGGLDTACRAYQDLTSSRCAGLGVCTIANDPATCTLWTDLPCADGGAGQQDGGAPGGDGGAPGGDGGVAPGGHGGCGCTVGSDRGPIAGAIALLLAVALARGPRRRPRAEGHGHPRCSVGRLA